MYSKELKILQKVSKDFVVNGNYVHVGIDTLDNVDHQIYNTFTYWFYAFDLTLNTCTWFEKKLKSLGYRERLHWLVKKTEKSIEAALFLDQ